MLGVAQYLLSTPLPNIRLLDNPFGVVGHQRVCLAVIGWIAVGIIAKSCQHRGNISHIFHDVFRYLTHPLGQSIQVHWLHYLITRAFNPANETWAIKLCLILSLFHILYSKIK